MLATKLTRSNLLRKHFCTAVYADFINAEPPQTAKGAKKLVISCKRKEYNHYKGYRYGRNEEVPLASKGWNHSKSKGDHFTVLADPAEIDGPCVPFDRYVFDERILKALDELNVRNATQFQSEVIPTIRTGKHVLMAAETGCGKTLGYLLPLIESISKSKPSENVNAPRLLVLVPNRELAYQVGDVAAHLCDPLGLKVKVLVGGQTKKTMINPDFGPVDVLVGTPGVVSKLSTVRIYKLHEVRHAVFDEADTLTDDSFNDRTEVLFGRVPGAQIVFVSATLPRKIPAFFEPIIDHTVQVKSERLHRPLLNVTQQFLRLIKSAKPSALLGVAKKAKEPILVFTNRNETCNWLAMFLRENGVACANINGDMNYAIRLRQWSDFLEGRANVLSATDVGSRGLNTVQVRKIVNYDFPLHVADYIHRVGRVGRLGSVPDSRIFNFITGPREVEIVKNIEMAIRTNGELKDVDGNITNIVKKRIIRKIQSAS